MIAIAYNIRIFQLCLNVILLQNVSLCVFLKAVSYEAMNMFTIQYPSAPESIDQPLYGSSLEWSYDFENVAELRGTDFWSEYAGTGMHWKKYEVWYGWLFMCLILLKLYR
jgi:hypothetical protein